MSEANVEIAKRALDALNRRDVDAFMECVTSDIEFTAAMSGTVAGGSLRGREGIEALFADIRDTWEEHRMVIEEIRDLGDERAEFGRREPPLHRSIGDELLPPPAAWQRPVRQ